MSNPIVDSEGNKFWINNNGSLHKKDEPIVQNENGIKYWYKNGEYHREDGPAIEYENGDEEWYLNGKLHRENGPAIKNVNKFEEWYLNGKRHRIDGPALYFSDGYKSWYINGKRHRIDGPAIEYENGTKFWYINDNRYSEDRFNEIVQFPILKVPYIVFNNSIYHIKFKEDVGIRLSYLLELYIDGVYIRHDNWIKQIILQFVKKSKQVEPMLDWIQENSNYFPNEFIERLFY
jgi:hypothetical protein